MLHPVINAGELYNEIPFPLYNIAELYIEKGEYELALEHLKHYILLVPLDLDTLFKTCGIALMSNRLNEVMQEMRSFIKEANKADPRVGVVKRWLKMQRNCQNK